MQLSSQDKILRLPDVKAKTGFGRSTIYALMASGDFPRSIRIGARAVGWLESEVNDWISQRSQARHCQNG